MYQQIENHILNPVIMSKTVRLNPLWVLLAVLVGATLGGRVGAGLGTFVGALIGIPVGRRHPGHRAGDPHGRPETADVGDSAAVRHDLKDGFRDASR